VVGIVSAIDHMARSVEQTAALLRTTVLVAPATPALEVVGIMRRERVQLVIVADSPERPLGIVTMKDLVEPLVGDLAAW
jgi:CBS domain containing-hemolysin-like protein